MTVTVTKTAGSKAEITWDPKADDPQGYLARLIEDGRLEDALIALGDNRQAGDNGSQKEAQRLARSTGYIARLLERREQRLAVALKNEYGLTWSQLADVLFEDPAKRSSAQRKYEAGLRQMGLPVKAPTLDDAASGSED
ncbi:hypothetical protein ABTZ93_39335 [Streptomyces sp. NPDC097941]|uniref:hypothetical protein n=1 Tax=Streptomyces sp. NPDC097941 TaxID=3155685 RepID=UPI00332637E6